MVVLFIIVLECLLMCLVSDIIVILMLCVSVGKLSGLV